MPWTLGFVSVKAHDGTERRLYAYTLNGSSPVQFLQGGTLWGPDAAAPAEMRVVPVLSTLAGDGLQVVNLADSAAKGTIQPGQANTGDKAWPVGIGGLAKRLQQTAVDENDRVDAWFDLTGRLITLEGTAATQEVAVVVNAVNSGNTTILAAPGSGLSIYVRKMALLNSAAIKRKVAIQDGAGGTALFRGTLAVDGGGVLLDYGSRGRKLTANTLLNCNLDAAGDVEVNLLDHYIAA